MILKVNARALLVLSGFICVDAWAIDRQTILDPQSIKLVDDLTFTPTLQVSERYDDNFRQVEHNTQSSWIMGATPSFVLAADTAKSRYAVAYTADNNTYLSSPEDNHTNHYLDADATLKFDSRHRLKIDAGYEKIEDTASEDKNPENDKYSLGHVGGLYTYGAPTARGQIDFGADYSQLRYQNSGGLNDDKERNTAAFVSTLYLRVAPRTRALAEARYTRFDYVSNTALNSNSVALLGGVTWDATAKTSGTFKVGAQQKRFDDSSIGNKSGSLWEVGVDWKPRTYSTFSLKSRHSLDEGDDGASSIDNLSTTLGWEHRWLERLSTHVSYTRSDQNYQNIDRDDKVDVFDLGVSYKMRRWLGVAVSYKHAQDDSNAANESYQRNIYLFSVTASL
jgi:hypothetical protein